MTIARLRQTVLHMVHNSAFIGIWLHMRFSVSIHFRCANCCQTTTNNDRFGKLAFLFVAVLFPDVHSSGLGGQDEIKGKKKFDLRTSVLRWLNRKKIQPENSAANKSGWQAWQLYATGEILKEEEKTYQNEYKVTLTQRKSINGISWWIFELVHPHIAHNSTRNNCYVFVLWDFLHHDMPFASTFISVGLPCLSAYFFSLRHGI